MQSIATPINHLDAPLILVELLTKVLMNGLFFPRETLCLSHWYRALGCNGQALIEVVSTGLSAVLYFCAEAVACC